jgi:hypothetical protein
MSGSYESRNNSNSTKKKMTDVQEMEEVLEETSTSMSMMKTTPSRPKYKSSADDVFCGYPLIPLYFRCARL